MRDDPAFVPHDPAGGGGPVGPVYRSTAPTMLTASTACQTTRLASHKQIAADLLPEADGSWAVEAEQGL